jgi:hypothetical protein
VSLRAVCHCGSIVIELRERPAHVIDCNCSLCRRSGALWAIVPRLSVMITARPDAIGTYEWGARTIRTCHCRGCGCTTHWEPVDAARDPRFGVNFRNLDPADLARFPVRRFDGADTWSYLD